VIDSFGNKWIGTNTTLSVFKEGGVFTSLKEIQKNETPETVGLLQNYPNPFISKTTIEYKVTEPGFVSLKVYNAMGTEVACLINEKKPVGGYAIDWTASGFGSGIYFCKMQNGKRSEVNKMLLMK
jgi:hypothetical protein